MKLGFDLDEVVANLTAEISKYVKSEHGIDWTPEDYGIADDDSIVTIQFVKTGDDKLDAEIFATACDPSFQAKAKPYKEAIACLKQLKRAGHSIHFVTSRNVGAEYEVALWFRKHNVPFDSIHNVGIQGDKGLFGRTLNLDFYMDDLEKHLEAMFRYKKRWRKGLALYTRPWNADSIDSSKFLRIDNWSQVLRHLGIHKR